MSITQPGGSSEWYIDTGRLSASGKKIFLGPNNQEFTEKEIEDIKLDLEAGKVMGQAQMNKLIAAGERSAIEHHLTQFEGLNEESANYLNQLGFGVDVLNNIDIIRDKHQARVKRLINGGDVININEMEGQYEQAKLAGEV